MNELVLQRILRDLVLLGKSYGGYLTYQTLTEALQSNISMESLDVLYEGLIGQGIELVDEIPEGIVIVSNIHIDRVVRGYRQREEVVRRKRKFGRDYHRGESIEAKNSTYCLEEVVDEILSLYLTSEDLPNELFFDIIERYHLPAVNISQLKGYLTDIGIVVPVVSELPTGVTDLGLIWLDDEDAENAEQTFLAEYCVQVLLQEINQIEGLTATQERELARSSDAGDTRAARLFIEANLLHCFTLAVNYTGRGLDFLDLVQEGFIGLIKAVEKYEWQQEVRFSAYSSWWIYQHITRSIADYGRIIRLPAHLQETLDRLQRALSNLVDVLGREPTAWELATKMDISECRVRELIPYLQPIQSWEEVSYKWQKNDEYPVFFLENYLTETLDKQTSPIFLHQALANALTELHPREKKVLQLRFGLDGSRERTLEEVSKHFGLTRERIRQIESKAFKKLRHSRISNTLFDFMYY